MINFNRIKAVFLKDIAWAKGNSKLLVIMLMPIFFIFFFSKIDKSIGMSFAMTFTAAFIGILSTSQLIIEEKRNNTLSGLLISPLTNSEFIIGKYLFSMSLVFIFNILTLSINDKIHYIFNPFLLISILTYGGFTILTGCFLGLFLENEKEISVIAPFIMIFFIMGNIASKIALNSDAFALFPEYHIVEQLHLHSGLSFKENLFHTGCNIVYFILSFFLTLQYTKFYFSSKRTTRFSIKTLIPISLIILSLFLSFYTNKRFFSTNNKTTDQSSMSKFSFNINEKFYAQLHFDPKAMAVNRTLKLDHKVLIDINDLKTTQVISISLWNTHNPKLKDEKTNQISELIGTMELESKNTTFIRKVKVKVGFLYAFTQPVMCGDHILQVSSKLKEINSPQLLQFLQAFNRTIENLSIECPNNALHVLKETE